MNNSEVIKINNEAIFSPSELLYIKANDNVQIHSKSSSEVTKKLNDLISKTFFEAGQSKLSSHEHLALCMSFTKDLFLSYRFKTFEEIELAFHKGVRKEYGEYFGLNIVTFINWIKSYEKDQKRIEALQKKINQINYSHKELTHEEKHSIHLKSICDCFDDYAKNGMLSKYKGYDDLTCYDILKKSDIIHITKEYSWEIWNKAKKNVEARLNAEKLKNAGDYLRIKEIVKRLETINNSDDIEIKNEAKRIALRDFFDGLIEIGEHINDRIETLIFD